MSMSVRVALCLMMTATCLAAPMAVGSASRGASVDGGPVTAVLSAMTIESQLLEQSLADKQVHKIQGIRFVSGRLGDRKVVLAVSGMGKVNAAIVATLMIEHFQPSEVLFSGIAGCLNPNLGLGDIVIASRTAQHDLLTLERDRVLPMEIYSPVDGKKNPEYFAADPRLLKAAQAGALRIKPGTLTPAREGIAPRIVTGLVVTGDMFVGADTKKKELQQRYKADAVEMEGAAVAQVCHQFGVPCLVIRSVSDLADDAADIDVERFMQVASDNAAALVKEIIAGLGVPADVPAAASQPGASR